MAVVLRLFSDIYVSCPLIGTVYCSTRKEVVLGFIGVWRTLLVVGKVSLCQKRRHEFGFVKKQTDSGCGIGR